MLEGGRGFCWWFSGGGVCGNFFYKLGDFVGLGFGFRLFSAVFFYAHVSLYQSERVLLFLFGMGAFFY